MKTELNPVEGRQRETNLEIMTVEGRQRETKEDKPGNHFVTKSVSLQELRTPSAEAVWGKKTAPPFASGPSVKGSFGCRETRRGEPMVWWFLFGGFQKNTQNICIKIS